MKIIHDRDHYIVYDDNGKFYCSTDTYGEAIKEIEENEEVHPMKINNTS